MSNTAPSRADPVVVFPLSRWCPPQETSQPHPPQIVIPIDSTSQISMPYVTAVLWCVSCTHCYYYIMDSLHTDQWSTEESACYIDAETKWTPFCRRHFQMHFLEWKYMNFRISIKTSLKFVPKDPINNTLALVQIMAWCRPGDKPLSEAMMVSLLTHICVTWPQWVNHLPIHQCCSNKSHMLTYVRWLYSN